MLRMLLDEVGNYVEMENILKQIKEHRADPQQQPKKGQSIRRPSSMPWLLNLFLPRSSSRMRHEDFFISQLIRFYGPPKPSSAMNGDINKFIHDEPERREKNV